MQDALRSVQAILKGAPSKPRNGLAIYCGGGTHEMFEPPEPLTRPLYHCGKSFVLDPLLSMLRDDEHQLLFGIVVLDGKACTIGRVRGVKESGGEKVDVLKEISTHNRGRCRRGGFSAARFNRIRDEVEHAFIVRVAEESNGHFLDEDGTSTVQGLIIAGPAQAKKLLGEAQALSAELRSRVLGYIDTAQIGRPGLSEACKRSTCLRRESAAAPELACLATFLKQLELGDDLAEELVIYGRNETVAAIENYACKTLLLSRSATSTMSPPAPEDEAPLQAGTAACAQLSFDDWVVSACREAGTEIVWIGSLHTEEVGMFESLGGVGGFLRWPFVPPEAEVQVVLPADSEAQGPLAEEHAPSGASPQQGHRHHRHHPRAAASATALRLDPSAEEWTPAGSSI